MSEIIKTDLTGECNKMQEKLAEQLSCAQAEIARLERCIARNEGIIKGLAYAVRCNGVSGSEVGRFEG